MPTPPPYRQFMTSSAEQIVSSTSFNNTQRRGEPRVRPFYNRVRPYFTLHFCAKHKTDRPTRRDGVPACANVSEEKRRTVWAEGEFSTFSERAHSAGRLGASSLDLFCLLFCVKTKERLSESKSKLVCFLPNVSSFGKKVSGFGQRPRDNIDIRTTSGQSHGIVPTFFVLRTNHN